MMKLVYGFLCVMFVSTQTMALAQGTKGSLQVMSLVSVTTPDAVINLIDQNMNELSKRGQRVEARWDRKLGRALPKLNAKISETIEQADEAQMVAQINELKTEATHSGDTEMMSKLEILSGKSLAEQKTELTALSQKNAAAKMPQIAHQIAVAGGAVPFLIHAKAALQEMSAQAKADMKNQNRSPASGFGFPNKYAKYACIILAVLLVLLCFGIPAVVYGVLVGAFLCMGVMSSLSPATNY